jgi:hypothetical protein
LCFQRMGGDDVLVSRLSHSFGGFAEHGLSVAIS